MCIGESKTEKSIKELLSRRKSMSPQKYAKELRAIHQCLQYQHVHRDIEYNAFSGVRKKDIMYPLEIIKLALLFKRNVEIYRGTGTNEEEYGISWTTCIEVARNCSMRHDNPVVLRTIVPKKDIVAFFDNGEKEVIVRVDRVLERFEPPYMD